ncbi:hypothetical protein MERGE_000873 [Pneumocystis wakefieldiae]|uniref:Uncharacterized protein n=1 Tax=Pneumocystis wakefieldiae TaxID=38082 RepID=A0A899G122_9ASCO|nr:hypothetical protein MERGE_000873 [Pneumocystis wakefieldiae]
MRSNYFLSGVLALAGLASAALNTYSQASSEFKLNDVIDLESHRIPYSVIDLVLVCFDKGSLNDLYTLKQGASYANLINSNIKFTRISKRCDSYFLKVIAYDTCNNVFVYFSSGFSVTVSGTFQYYKDCVPGQESRPTQTSEPLPQPTQAPKPTTSDAPHDETPTKSQTKVTTTTKEQQSSPSQSVPLPTTHETKPIETLTTATSSQTSPSDVKPTKKPDDVDNSASVLTFKLFGTLFAVLVIFLFS